MKTFTTLALTACAMIFATSGYTQGFSFSRQQENDAAAAREKEQARQQMLAERLSTPCRTQLKDKKIMVLIGEQQTNGYIYADQQNYGPHFNAINQRLQALGLRTYTPEEIRKQIAQAEIDAYFKGNPDAALSASKRLGASFVLRGLITTETGVNRIIPVNEVIVDMGFTLADSGGRMISNTDAHSGSYAGSDVRKIAADLVNEQADEVVSKLYQDYCTKVVLPAPAPKKK